MKLYYSNASPYAAKVRILARELGLIGQIEEEIAAPATDGEKIAAVNPLGKIPALQRADGSWLFDSPLICEYLCSLAPSTAFLPASGEPRWTCLRLQALADGMMDATVAIALEKRRPAEQQSPNWLGRWDAAIARSLTDLEADVPYWGDAWTLGQMAVSAAIGYLHLRQPDRDTTIQCPNLAYWAEAQLKRASVQETAVH